MRLRVNWVGAVIGLTVIAATAVAFGVRLPALVAAEEAVFDQYQRWSPRPFDAEGPVRVIDIDEASLAVFGQWPWPRSDLAELVDRLTAAGAAAIAFDVLFAEPDRTSPRAVLEAWNRIDRTSDASSLGVVPDLSLLETLPDHDALLTEAIGRAPVVLGTILGGTGGETAPRAKAGIAIRGSDPSAALVRFPGASLNLPRLADAAAGLGSVSLAPAGGGVVRRVPMIAMVGQTKVPALAIEALRVAQGAGGYMIRSSDADPENISATITVTGLRVGALDVPLDPDGALRVRFAGEERARIIRAAEALRGPTLAPEIAAEVAGRIVLVGASAAGLRDLVTTPLAPSVPGVVVHAEIVEQILAGAYLTRPDWAYGAELLTIVLPALVIVILLTLNLGTLALGVAGISAAGMAATSWLAFEDAAVLISPVAPMLASAAAYLAVGASNYFRAEANRREITRQFQHFVAPEVIDDIIADPGRHLTPGGARRELTILFLDVRRFSTLTERMQPEEVITFINRLLTPLTDVILEHEGTVDKYMGDAVMAFWNAPRLTENHERKAVLAAMAFFPAIERVNSEFAGIGLPAVDIGVGINTGLCSVGNMGSTRRLAYSCVGDAVNLASRLEGQTKQYGVRILIGAATAARVGDLALVEIDRVAVKGRSQAERIFTVAGDARLKASTAFENLTARLAGAREAYLARDWDRAETGFIDAAALGVVGQFDPGRLAAVFRERITAHRETPPPADWDGAWIALSK